MNLRTIIGPLLAMLVWGLISIDEPTMGQEKKQTPVKVSAKNDAPVIEFDTVGGYRMANPREFTPTPRLQIFSNGKVVCGRPEPQFAEVVYQMPQQELMELLEFVVNEQQFFSITKKKIDTQITESGNRVRVADAPTSLFGVEVDRGTHRCEIYAVEFVVKQFPDISELQRISKIQQRLMAVAIRAQLGSEERKTSILKAVNDALKKESPAAKPLTVGDIQYAATLQDKSFKVVFQRNDHDAEGNFTDNINIQYRLTTPESEPELRVRVRPIARR
jgi:hypothetical protein